MKLKLLFFPLALVFSIIIAIWYIKPEFLNVKNNKSALEVRNQKKDDLQKRMKNIESLSVDLDRNPEYKGIVMRYIPKEAYVEQIIDSVNYLAGDMLGVSLINISLSKGNDSVRPVSIDETEKAANQHGFILDSPEEVSSRVQNIQLNDIALAITIVGKYENIKNYLKQIRIMRHMNEIESISLSAVLVPVGDSVSSEEVAGGEIPSPEEKNLVQAEIAVSFKYLPFSPANGYNVLSKNEFDYSVINRLKDNFQGGIEIPVIRVGERGKTNPFE